MKFVFAIFTVLVLSGISGAQTKISGTMHCGRPDTDQQLDVGDVDGHTISLNQTTCTWTKSLVIEGVTDTVGISTQMSEVQNNTYKSHGYFVDNMNNGDKIFLRYEVTVGLADGSSPDIQGKWIYTGGTGKFKGIQGDGTFSGHGSSFDLEGEYSLAKQ